MDCRLAAPSSPEFTPQSGGSVADFRFGFAELALLGSDFGLRSSDFGLYKLSLRAMSYELNRRQACFSRLSRKDDG